MLRPPDETSAERGEAGERGRPPRTRARDRPGPSRRPRLDGGRRLDGLAAAGSSVHLAFARRDAAAAGSASRGARARRRRERRSSGRLRRWIGLHRREDERLAGRFGTLALSPNSSNSPGAIVPPSQVTVAIRSVCISPKTSTGGSSFSIVTVRLPAGLGWKLTKKRPSGSCSTTLVVSASGRSVGTRTAKREKLSAGTSFGLSVTWALAAGTASQGAGEHEQGQGRLHQFAVLSDRDGDRRRGRVELAAACLDAKLPVARERQLCPLDDEVAGAGPVCRQTQRADLAAGERRRDGCLVDVGRLPRVMVGQVEVDLVASGRGRIDDQVQLEIAERCRGGVRASRCDLRPCRRLGDEHGRDADDRHHQRRARRRPCGGSASALLPRRGRARRRGTARRLL